MIRRSGINRADLLLLLNQEGEEFLKQPPPSFSYEYKEPEKIEEEKAPLTPAIPGSATKGITKELFPVTDLEPRKGIASFWYVKKYEKKKRDENSGREPDWLSAITSFGEHEFDLDSSKHPEPPFRPIMAWSRLWPFIKDSLGLEYDSNKIDVKKTISILSQGKTLTRIPREHHKGWAISAQLILDFDKKLLPFWRYIFTLRERIKKMRGRSGLEILMLEDGPESYIRLFKDRHIGQKKYYGIPPIPSAIFVISDLGCVDRDSNRKDQWVRFGKKLKQAGHYPIALVPCSLGIISKDLMPYWRIACWGGRVRLPRFDQDNSSPRMCISDDRVENEQAAESVLSLLSAAILVEPGLLREVRMLFPIREVDVATEALVWNHPDVITSHTAFCIKKEAIEKYRTQFKQAAPDEIREKALALIKKYHINHFKGIRLEEECIKRVLRGEDLKGEGRRYIQQIVKTLYDEDYKYSEGLKAYVERMFSRTHPEMRREDAIQAAWAKINLKALKEGKIQVPEGIDLGNIAWVISKPSEPVNWQISQKGQTLILLSKRGEATDEQGFSVSDSNVAKIKLASTVVKLTEIEDKSRQGYFLHLEPGTGHKISLKSIENIELETDYEKITICSMIKEDWASQIGRDWIGLYGDVEIQGVTQRFRWIAPGRFMVGSPESEAGRYGDEAQHEVILTKGYWLAETACTQGLWEAVMGNSPSRFKEDKNNPVDTVSWKNAMEFIDKLNKLKPALCLRLPTEAEWEYACRAGTTTPFSFGENITPDQVNYDGNNPYSGGKKGKYREKTMPVKSFPPNVWGLYEMHGNVWEWCADWYKKEYPKGSVVDPKGPLEGGFRLARGQKEQEEEA